MRKAHSGRVGELEAGGLAAPKLGLALISVQAPLVGTLGTADQATGIGELSRAVFGASTLALPV